MSRPLRILLICLQDLGGAPHPVPAYRFWRKYFRAGIAEGGHVCFELPGYDWAAGLLPRSPADQDQWRTEIWSRAIADIRREHAFASFDFVLSYLYPNHVQTEAITTIKSLGIPVVNFFCDNVREFRRVPASFRPFSLHWVPEFKARALYEKAGLPHLRAPMPCWIEPQTAKLPAKELHGVSFIGTRDELRSSLFAEAFKLGWKAEIMGFGWASESLSFSPDSLSPPSNRIQNQLSFVRQHGGIAWARKLWGKLRPYTPEPFDFEPHLGPPVPPGEFLRRSQESAVCVGVNRYPSARHSFRRPDTYSRLRDIEAPMAGACYLTEWTDGIEELYHLGVEIETYRNAHELVAKSNELMKSPERRQSMRKAAQRRALTEHSIARSIARIARQLRISA